MRMLVVRNPIAAVAVVIGLLASGAPSVHAIPLTDLLAGAEIRVADTLFDNWSLDFDNSDFDNLVELSDIDAGALADDRLNPGIRFTAADGALTVSGGGRIHLGFSYRVTALDPRLVIKDASLALVEFTVPDDPDGDKDSDVLRIIDTVFRTDGDKDSDKDGDKDNDKSCKNDGDKDGDKDADNCGTLIVSSDPSDGTMDGIQFNPEVMVIQKIDIFVNTSQFGGTFGIEMFDARKSQERIAPEPATLALLGVGGVGFVVVRRRRRRPITTS